MTDGGTQLDLTSTGALRSVRAVGRQLLLHPAGELEDGVAGLWVRVRTGRRWTAYPLVGTGSHGSSLVTGDRGSLVANRHGEVPEASLGWTWALRRLDDRAGWSWEVGVTNGGDVTAEVDLVMVQDLALSDEVVLEANRLYPSQYLDLSPVDIGPHGTGVAVRQNMPGPSAPWALAACWTRAVGWATDALQLTGRGRPEGAPWPGLEHDLPSARLQHEHAVAALQSEPTALARAESVRSGFVVVIVGDHPAATSDDDARVVADLLAGGPPVGDDEIAEPSGRLEAAPSEEHLGGTPGTAPSQDRRSLLDTAPALLPRRLTDAELSELVGDHRLQAEEVDGQEVSWFTPAGGHVVTGAKQAAVLRPHGQVLRPLTSLLPDEDDVTSTVWMDGSFCSHLTRGHVALGRVLSAREDLLGIARLRGLRVAVDVGEGWQLLGTPSLWLNDVDGARWWYALPDGMLQVSATAPDPSGACLVEVGVLSGPPVPALAVLHLDWAGAPGAVGEVTREENRVRVEAPPSAHLAALEIGLGGGASGAAVADDGPLFADSVSRGEPALTLRIDPSTGWSLTLTPHRRESAGPAAAGAPSTSAENGGGPHTERATGADLWGTIHDTVSLSAEHPGGRSRLVSRLDQVTGWFAHDAAVHYLSPRGLEQHTGGLWGTRDVCQGPVGLLRSWARHEEWRDLLLLVLRGQQVRGDWPQAFDFLPGHRRDGVEDSHGDVVYWPVLAVAQYLQATGDLSLLEDEVGFTGEDAPGGSGSVAEHLGRALDVIEGSFLDGTSLPAYGHGDWNDSLQPADPELARRMVSTWTAVLQVEALGRLAEAVGTAYPDLAERARRIADATDADLHAHLLVDGVLAGYGVVGVDGRLEPMIHPRDTRTGLTYSVLPMIHAVAGDVLTPEEARHHLALVERHLLGPDGARLFDRPVGYRGGPTRIFQRAEASSFFGREVGIMYMHAHLRYAEALARVGDGPALLEALARAVPVGIRDLVPSAAPRQANTYSSSSDAAFPDRYTASEEYDRALRDEVPLEAGWRVYSSGPGLFLEILTQRMLGVRHAGADLELDPVLDPALGTVRASVPVAGGRTARLEIVCGGTGHGVASVSVGGRPVPTRPLDNPYREPGVAVAWSDVLGAAGAGGVDAGGVVDLRVVTH